MTQYCLLEVIMPQLLKSRNSLHLQGFQSLSLLAIRQSSFPFVT